ncbi:MAG: WGR domain-containing protein [Spirochaetia bacterium]
MVVTFVKTTGNRRYYYTLHDYQTTLFGKYTLTVIWGPSIETGRRKVYTFDSRKEMDKHLRGIVQRRFALGYTLLYSYSRSQKYRKIFSNSSHKDTDLREASL